MFLKLKLNFAIEIGLLKFKGQNHHCPDRGAEEGIGKVDYGEYWDNIDYKRCYILYQS